MTTIKIGQVQIPLSLSELESFKGILETPGLSGAAKLVLMDGDRSREFSLGWIEECLDRIMDRAEYGVLVSNYKVENPYADYIGVGRVRHADEDNISSDEDFETIAPLESEQGDYARKLTVTEEKDDSFESRKIQHQSDYMQLNEACLNRIQASFRLKQHFESSVDLIDQTALKIRFENCLLGALAGNCFGNAFKSHIHTDKNPTHLSHQMHRSMTDLSKVGYQFEICIMMDIARSLLETRTVDRYKLAERFAQTYKEEKRQEKLGNERKYCGLCVKKLVFYMRYQHLGNETLSTLRRLNPFETAESDHETNCVAAAFFAPIPLFFHANPDAVFENCIDACRAIKFSGNCLVACCVQSFAILRLLHLPTGQNCRTLLIRLIDECLLPLTKYFIIPKVQAIIPDFKNLDYVGRLSLLKSMLPPQSFQETIKSEHIPRFDDVIYGLFAFLQALNNVKQDNYQSIIEEAITEAVKITSFNPQTVSCLAGALAGAYGSSRDNIPPWWSGKLEKFQDVKRLANNIFKASPSASEDALNPDFSAINYPFSTAATSDISQGKNLSKKMSAANPPPAFAKQIFPSSTSCDGKCDHSYHTNDLSGKKNPIHHNESNGNFITHPKSKQFYQTSNSNHDLKFRSSATDHSNGGFELGQNGTSAGKIFKEVSNNESFLASPPKEERSANRANNDSNDNCNDGIFMHF